MLNLRVNIQSIFNCYRPLLDCGTKFVIKNGYANFDGEDKNIGHSVPITCKTGYQLIGSRHTTCLPDGSWSRNTTCRIRGRLQSNQTLGERSDDFTVPELSTFLGHVLQITITRLCNILQFFTAVKMVIF